MNHIYKIGDQVITTRGHVGQVTDIIEGNFSIDISPEFANYQYKDEVEAEIINGAAHYVFIDEEGNEKYLVQGVDFDFKNNDRYTVKFQKNKRDFHPASLRLFDKPYEIMTIQTDDDKMETHIMCDYHTKLPDGEIIGIDLKSPEVVYE